MPDQLPPLRARIEAFARARPLHPELLDRWMSAAEPDAAALLELAESLRLGENHLRDLFEWAEEIAARERGTVAAVLASTPVQAVRSRGLGRNETIKAVREALRRLRFPQLAALQERLSRCVRALRLPPDVRLVLPENLNDDEIRIEVRARDSVALAKALTGLREAIGRPEMEELFGLLREAPSDPLPRLAGEGEGGGGT